MKTLSPLPCHRNGHSGFGAPAPLILATLLAAATGVHADTPYSATGWVKDVPVLPILCTNAAGQILLRGNAHTVAVQSTDPRLTGKRLVFANAAYLPDGTAQVWGTACHQVGTFDSNTNFTATAGLWEINYTGVMGADFSLTLSLAGYGSGGAVDGQRIEETMTREPASGLVDLTKPYNCAGTIKAAPVNIFEVVDNFDNNSFTGGSVWGKGICVETNKEFCAIGNQFIQTRSVYDSYVFGGYKRTRTVPDGMTLEWRADLVRLDDNATNTAILALGTDFGAGYAFHMSRDFVLLLKWSSSFAMSILFCEQKPLRNTNVVLSLALTRMGQDLAITPRVLDKANPNTVLYQHSPVIDTPNSEATLDPSQFLALSGITFLDLVPDAMESPPASFWPLLGVFQNTDGHQPLPMAVFDNLELLTYEVPRVSLSPAVQVIWPAPAGAYSVECGPTPTGPWQPVLDLSVPGRQQLTVPANAEAQFFRLRQAP